MSESEFEDGPENQVTLKKDMIMRGATNLEGAVSAIRLSEIGPRLKIKLVKIEEGICDGEVLYHEYVKKTPDEVAEIREKLKTRKQKEKVKQKEKADKQAIQAAEKRDAERLKNLEEAARIEEERIASQGAGVTGFQTALGTFKFDAYPDDEKKRNDYRMVRALETLVSTGGGSAGGFV